LSIIVNYFFTKIRFATKIFKNQGVYFVFALMNAANCIGEQNKNIFPINDNIDNIAPKSIPLGASMELIKTYLLFDQLRPCEVL
jgi:hypothetical protein